MGTVGLIRSGKTFELIKENKKELCHLSSLLFYFIILLVFDVVNNVVNDELSEAKNKAKNNLFTWRASILIINKISK